MKLKAAKKTLPYVVTAAGLSLASYGLAQNPAPVQPRGPDIDPLAGNCRIGPFPQTTKAGPYNELCEIMSDAEKCLALLKSRFKYNGEIQKVNFENEKEKFSYCLETLSQDLGLEEVEPE